MKCNTARQQVYMGSGRLARWRAGLHLRLCGECRAWARQQRATENLLDSLAQYPLPGGLEDTLQATIPARAAKPRPDAPVVVPQDDKLRARNRRVGFVFVAVAALVILAIGLYLINRPPAVVVEEPGTGGPARVPAQYAQMVIPEDFDNGTPFEGNIIALIEPTEEILLPDLLPLKTALAQMLLGDLARDPAVRVVSRERISNALGEFQMTETGLIEPGTAQGLGQAVSADTLVALLIAGSENNLTVALQLISPQTGEAAWSKKFTGSAGNLPALEKEMLAALRARLNLDELKAQPPARGEPATLAIFDFEPAGPATKLDKNAADLADLLASYLSMDGTVRLVERQRIAAILEEQQLILTQRSGADQAWLGQMLGAQRFCYTTMTQWKNRVRFDAHLVDPQTGVIAAALTVEGATEKTPELLAELAHKISASLTISGEVKLPKTSQSAANFSLEAAIHFARGYKAARTANYAKAIVNLEKAAYLAPNDKETWWQLTNACFESRRYDAAAQHAKIFISKYPEIAGDLNLKLAEIERARRKLPGVVSAGRAFMQDPNFTEPWKIGAASEQIILGLIWQDKWQEALEFCIALKDTTDTENESRAWSWLLGIMGYSIRGVEPEPGSLAILRRSIEEMPANDEFIDQRTAHQIYWVLMAHCFGEPIPYADAIFNNPSQHLQQALTIAEMAGEKFKDGERLPAMAHVSRGLILARMGRPKKALEALQYVLDNYPDADVDQSDWISLAPPANGMVHYYIGAIQEHRGNRRAALASYRKAVELLDPSLSLSEYLINKLEEAQAALPEKAPYEKRVIGYPPLEWRQRGLRLVDWLRAHDYQLWGASQTRNPRYIGGDAGTLIITYNGFLSWNINVDDLRSWVAHGGRLLILYRSLGHGQWFGKSLVETKYTRDPTLNSILYPFGMRMDPTTSWIQAEQHSLRITGGEHRLGTAVKAFDYTGDWWPLECPEGTAVLRVEQPGLDAPGPAVAAAMRFGLGRVAVVTLREWFPAGSYEGWVSPEKWENELFSDIMSWLTAPELDAEKSKITQSFSQPWQTYSQTGPLFSIPEFREIRGLPGNLAAETRFLTSRLACSFEDEQSASAQTAYDDLRALARASDDSWIRRYSAFYLCRVATQVARASEADKYYRAAIGDEDEKDVIWAKANLQMGNLWIWKGDFKKAERFYRQVVATMPHSEERIRALFFLAYALESQERWEDAVRLYKVIEKVYGEVIIADGIEYYWSDPWEKCWPVDERTQQKKSSYILSDPIQYRLAQIKQAKKGASAPAKSRETGRLRGLWERLKDISFSGDD